MLHATATIDDRLRPRLATAALCSLLVHAAVAAALITGGLGRADSPLATLEHTPAAQPPEPIRPGIERSNHVTINWLGFADPTPHSAPPAPVDQPELSPLESGDPLAIEVEPIDPSPSETEPVQIEPAESEPIETEPTETEPVEPEPIQPKPAEAVAPESTPEPSAEPAILPEPDAAEATPPASVDAPTPPPSPPPSAPVLAFRGELPEVSPQQVFRSLQQAAAEAGSLLSRLDAQLEAQVQARREARLQAQREARPDTPTEQTASAPPPPAPNPAGQARDAIQSPKESSAVATEQVFDVVPGRPAAAQGLDITTVAPRWTITTRLLALPRNPVVRIEFQKSGAVARASFLPGRATGYPDVDGPLMDAIYAWRAKGKALEALPANSPEHTVPLTLRIVLVPEQGTIRPAQTNR